jgi:hypothetical protein
MVFEIESISNLRQDYFQLLVFDIRSNNPGKRNLHPTKLNV